MENSFENDIVPIAPPGKEVKINKPGLKNGTYKKYDPKAEAIFLILENKNKLIAIGFISFILSFFIFYFFYSSYQSTISFIIDTSDPAEMTISEPEHIALSQLSELSKNRMYLLLYSDEMAIRLDKQIEIGNHYSINKNNPGYLKEITGQLNKHVFFQKNEMNTVNITVSDEDKNYAALLANTIFTNLNQMIRELVRANLHYKERVYRIDIENLLAGKNMELQKLTDLLNKIPTENRNKLYNNEDLYYLKRDLNNTFSSYENSSNKLILNQYYSELTSNVLKDTSLQTLYLLNKAYPNERNGTYKFIFYSFLISITIMVYFLFMVHFLKKNKAYLQLFIKRDFNL